MLPVPLKLQRLMMTSVLALRWRNRTPIVQKRVKEFTAGAHCLMVIIPPCPKGSGMANSTLGFTVDTQIDSRDDDRKATLRMTFNITSTF